jgi:vanillate monooxygenase ferredoxin subunit
VHRLLVRVDSIRREAQSVKAFVLATTGVVELPPFTPGAHIDLRVRLPSGEPVWRSYSLVNDPSAGRNYEIGVLRTRDGGGSAWMHDEVEAGDTLEICPPTNQFPLATHARQHLLIAGGIGITPLLSMARVLARRGDHFRLLYLARSARHMAFAEAVDRLGEAKVVKYLTQQGDCAQRLDPAQLIGALVPGRHIYVCGPRSLIQDTLAAARRLGYADESLHFELFNAGPRAGETAFEVELARSRVRFTVEPGRTILEEAHKRGIFPSSDCTRGECGSCLTRVIEGQPLHRDVYLTDAEKATNDFMTICCSRSRSSRLVLDL